MTVRHRCATHCCCCQVFPVVPKCIELHNLRRLMLSELLFVNSRRSGMTVVVCVVVVAVMVLLVVITTAVGCSTRLKHLVQVWHQLP